MIVPAFFPLDAEQESPAKIGAVMIKNNSSGMIVEETSAKLLRSFKSKTRIEEVKG